MKAAEAAALKKAREENPDMTEDELKVKVSDAVKAQEAQARARRHRPHPEAYARMNADHAAMLGGGAFGRLAGGMPHVPHAPHAPRVPHAPHVPHVVGPPQGVPLMPDIFGAPFVGMPPQGFFQPPQFGGGFGVPAHPMAVIRPPMHMAQVFGFDPNQPFGVAPQPFGNFPPVYNHANWAFMQQEQDPRRRGN